MTSVEQQEHMGGQQQRGGGGGGKQQQLKHSPVTLTFFLKFIRIKVQMLWNFTPVQAEKDHNVFEEPPALPA